MIGRGQRSRNLFSVRLESVLSWGIMREMNSTPARRAVTVSAKLVVIHPGRELREGEMAFPVGSSDPYCVDTCSGAALRRSDED